MEKKLECFLMPCKRDKDASLAMAMNLRGTSMNGRN